ncbi:Ldh family oxidoreductase [Planctomicrobium sp. SH664]|uniref:Ldh family oxidoreductase n=1 Tax=Planctomicrobium sp. SH664 TaxID=3448125 RepID=UPI003F5B2C34
MPTFQHDQLFRLAQDILVGAGASVEDAATVASELADANIVGHDSHGVMRLNQYVDFVRDGHVKLGAQAEVLKDGPSYAVLDGHFNFGQVTTRFGLDLALQKAKETGLATVLMRNVNHIGRLGAYTHEAANNGMVALMAVNAPGPGGVAPFGGIDRRLGTNPISIAAPAGRDALVLDMTTSATAEGKLRVSKQKGEMIPEGLIIDGHGQPSCDPNAYYNKPYGAILPLGGALMGHKGFGLSVMVDVLCGILSGSGVCREDLPRGANGVWLHLLEIERFLPRSEYDRWMATYLESIKGCRRLPGVDEILMPGEIEQRRKQQRLAQGVDIPDETWRQINELAASLNVKLSV